MAFHKTNSRVKKSITFEQFSEQFKDQRKLVRIFANVLSLTVDLEMDDVKQTEDNKLTIEKCKDLLEHIDPILNKFFESAAVSSSTFFNVFPEKIEYIVNKEYDKYLRQAYKLLK